MSTPEQSPPPARPWWRFGHVWLVIAGPAIVVVAGFVTFYLAARAPDPVLPTLPPPSAASTGQGTDIGQAPAMQGRNHAATGVLPTPAPAKP